VASTHHPYLISLDGHPNDTIPLGAHDYHFLLHLALGLLFEEWQVHCAIQCMSSGVHGNWDKDNYHNVLLELGAGSLIM